MTLFVNSKPNVSLEANNPSGFYYDNENVQTMLDFKENLSNVKVLGEPTTNSLSDYSTRLNRLDNETICVITGKTHICLAEILLKYFLFVFYLWCNENV